MNQVDCKWILGWDFLAWKEVSKAASPYTQVDWNWTLLTRINQCSAQIHQMNLRGGADTITLNRFVFEIIEAFDYYDSKTKMLSGRYKVIVDNSIKEEIIYVGNMKMYNARLKVGGVPLKIDEDLDDEYRQLIIKRETFETEEQITEYKRGQLACIPIKNYRPTS